MPNAFQTWGQSVNRGEDGHNYMVVNDDGSINMVVVDPDTGVGVSVNDDGQMHVSNYVWDGVQSARMLGDEVFHGVPVGIRVEHHEIHEGDHYYLCDYALEQGLGAVINFILTTPDTEKWAHFTFYVFSSTGCTLEVYEGASSNADGTLETPRNNNRNSLNTSVMTIRRDPTGIVAGTTRLSGYLAGSNRSAGFAERVNEVVLKRNTTYLMRITSLAASNNISWCSEWYEHTSGG